MSSVIESSGPDLEVHPLSLHLKGHLDDLQNVRQCSLPVVHLLLKGFHVARRLHRRQRDLVVLQQLKYLLRRSVVRGREGEREGGEGGRREGGTKLKEGW